MFSLSEWQQPMADLDFDRHFDARPGQVEQLSPLVRRILCGNPGPYTFTGTSTFIVGRGQVAVIDPGPDDDAHLAALLAALSGESVSHILVTHSHADHSSLAARLKAATGAVTVAHGGISAESSGGLQLDASVDRAFVPDARLAHGEAAAGPGWTLEGVFTPGHMSNHMCFALREERTLFSGDHVMAWATSVVAPPDGHMGSYMASLRRLLERDDSLYLPAHGPARREPRALVRGYIGHRRMREAAILARLRAGDRRIGDIVKAIYADIDPKLHGAAGLSTRAHLEHLIEQGLVRQTEDAFEAV
jgi:glyoxylase-like metal-dependent hydrolase (beta-lactamase superfamily II)